MNQLPTCLGDIKEGDGMLLPEFHTPRNPKNCLFYSRKSAIKIHPKTLLNNLFVT